MQPIFYIFIFCYLSHYCWCKEQAYMVTNDAIEVIEGDPETIVDFSNLKIVQRERFLNGTLTMTEDMDNEHFKFSMEIYISSTGSEAYRRMALDVPKTGMCDGYKKLYKEFVQPTIVYGENSDLPYVGDEVLCPFPAGSYFLKNIVFNTETWPNELPRGIMKTVLRFYKNDAACGGLILKYRIEDKD